MNNSYNQSWVQNICSEDFFIIKLFIERKTTSKTHQIEQKKVNDYFTRIGTIVLILFLSTTLSFTFFIYNVLDGYYKLLSIPLGVFCGLVIANIYYFLLFTMAPNSLPIANKKLRKYKKIVDLEKPESVKNIFSVSFFMRFCFISFLAFIIAQPLNVFLIYDLFPESLAVKENVEIDRYKTHSILKTYLLQDDLLFEQENELFKNFIRDIQSEKIQDARDQEVATELIQSIKELYTEDYYAINNITKLVKILDLYGKLSINTRDTEKLKSFIDRAKQAMDSEFSHNNEVKNKFDAYQFQDEKMQAQFDLMQQLWHSNMDQKIEAHQNINKLLEKSTFYILKIRILNQGNLVGIIISFLFLFAFLLPVRDKFHIRKHTSYYNFKAHLEKEMVVNYYSQYIKDYEQILNEKINNCKEECLENLHHSLEKLRRYNSIKYDQIVLEVQREYATDQVLEKYEHWDNPPFRTVRKKERKYQNSEDFLKKLYLN